MADWIMSMLEAQRTGIYNVTGPSSLLTMEHLLETCRTATHSAAQFEWVDEAFLLAHHVAPFSHMPLWLPHDQNGLLSMNINKALAAGLSFRPLVDTIQETLAWDKARSSAEIANKPRQLQSGGATQAGISREREKELLNAWHSMQKE
jgi:2'-hydroxyisoflavone reductase